jgi:STE24 endopeptidase
MASSRTEGSVRATLALLLVALACLWSTVALSETAIVRDLPVGLHVPAAAKPGPNFNVDRATEAWLGLLSPEQRQLSDAYFEGGYWLQLWDTVWSVGAFAVLLWTGLSRRMRDLAERAVRWRYVQAMIYGALFLVAFYVLRFPWTVYVGFVREHAYGLSNLTFAGWLKEEMIGLAIFVIIGSVALGLLYVALRRAGARWWLWGTGLVFGLLLFVALVTPVFLAPLYNDYKPLPDGPVRDAVFSLARANEIPTEHVAWFDNSKQTTRVSANVSGLLGVTRISLNDNLLEKTSLPEIKAVLGHEMGHYVLNHIWLLSVYLTLLYAIGLWVVHAVFDRALARWGPPLGLRDRADPAVLPLMAAILVVVLLLLTPFTNSTVRTAEAEADAFGLNAAREPEGFAMAAMRLSTYRKLKPGPVEEFVFYDHPSGYERVQRAVLWRKENLPVGD